MHTFLLQPVSRITPLLFIFHPCQCKIVTLFLPDMTAWSPVPSRGSPVSPRHSNCYPQSAESPEAMPLFQVHWIPHRYLYTAPQTRSHPDSILPAPPSNGGFQRSASRISLPPLPARQSHPQAPSPMFHGYNALPADFVLPVSPDNSTRGYHMYILPCLHFSDTP